MCKGCRGVGALAVVWKGRGDGGCVGAGAGAGFQGWLPSEVLQSPLPPPHRGPSPPPSPPGRGWPDHAREHRVPPELLDWTPAAG